MIVTVLVLRFNVGIVRYELVVPFSSIAVLFVSKPVNVGLCGPLTPAVTFEPIVPLLLPKKSAAMLAPASSFNRQYAKGALLVTACPYAGKGATGADAELRAISLMAEREPREVFPVPA